MRTRKTLALAVVLVAPLCAVLTSFAMPKLFGMLLLVTAPFFGALSLLGVLIAFLVIDALARINFGQNRDFIPF